MNKDIEERLTDYINAVRDGYTKEYGTPDGGYPYALGYFQSFMGRVLTAYVPADKRHELIAMFDEHIKMLKDAD